MRSVKVLRRTGLGLVIAAGVGLYSYAVSVMQGSIVWERYTGGGGRYEWSPLEAIFFWATLAFTGAACVAFLLAAIGSRRAERG